MPFHSNDEWCGFSSDVKLKVSSQPTFPPSRVRWVSVLNTTIAVKRLTITLTIHVLEATAAYMMVLCPKMCFFFKEAGDSFFVSSDMSPKLLRLPPIARVDKPSCDQLLLLPVARKATLHTNCDHHWSWPPIVAAPLTARSFHRKYMSKMFNRKTPLPPRCTPDEEYVLQTRYGDMVNTDDDRITPRCFPLLESLLR